MMHANTKTMYDTLCIFGQGVTGPLLDEFLKLIGGVASWVTENSLMAAQCFC